MGELKMANPFAKKTEKKVELFDNSAIETWIKTSSKPKKSSICCLIVGNPKVGKTGIALDTRNEQDKKEGKKVIAIELNSDNGCELNKREHHNNDENIIVLNPREYSIDENGELQPDYIRTMAKIKATLKYLQDNYEKLNVKSLVFDGLDIFLSEICESQMRIDNNIDVSGGVSMRYWKKRNEYYFKVLNMLFDIDVDKYFITHYSDRRRDEKTGEYMDDRTVSKLNPNLVYACQKSTADKMHQIIEVEDKTKVKDGVVYHRLIATIIADRRDLKSHMKKIVIAETNEKGEINWYGNCILEEK